MTLATRSQFLRNAQAAKAGNPKALPIVQQITRARIQKGVTVEELAKLSGWGLDTIMAMEQARFAVVNARMLTDLAQALGFELVLAPRNRDEGGFW